MQDYYSSLTDFKIFGIQAHEIAEGLAFLLKDEKNLDFLD